MKNLIVSIVVIFLLFSKFCSVKTFAQDEITRSVFYHPNGNISSEGYMKNSVPIGIWINYYNTGIKRSEGKFYNNQPDSSWVFYSVLGDTSEIINYLEGTKSGFHIKYRHDNDSTKKVVSKELYLKGVLNGKSYYYRQNHIIVKNYSNGILDGYSKTLDDKGNNQVKHLSIYRKGKLIKAFAVNRTDSLGKKTGKWIDFYENGKVKSQKTFNDGLIHGAVNKYNEDGILVSVIEYKYGVPLNLSESFSDIQIKEEYNSDSSLVFQGFYRDSIAVGIHRWYNSKGNVIRTKIFNEEGNLSEKGILNDDGTRIGDWVSFYRSGVVRSKGSYLNNRQNGVWYYYYNIDTAVVIEQKGEFSLGNLNGEWIWYFTNGNVRRIENYSYGILNGLYVEYSEKEQKIVEGEFAESLRNGIWNYNFVDYIEQGSYIDDEKDGKWQKFYLNGKVLFEGKYDRGRPDGKHLLYYKNGNIKEERYYDEGLKVHTWRTYDEYGVVTMQITYHEGKEYSINDVKLESF